MDTVVGWTPPVTRAKVLGARCGMLLVLGARIEGRAFRFDARLSGVQSPHPVTGDGRDPLHLLLPRGAPARGRMRRAARDAATERLRELALGRLATVRVHRNEVWGRVVADVTVDGTDESLSDAMVADGYLAPYSTGTRRTWDAMLV
jgi:hypothetical protein